jgi:hypothetical protein
MGLLLWIIPGVALCLLSLMAPPGRATAYAAPLQSSAQWVTVVGKSLTSGPTEDHGPGGKVVVPVQSRTALQRQSAATVPATLAAVDWAITRGQVIMTPSARCPDALPHAGVTRGLLGTRITQGDTMAEEMTCVKDNGTHCILAKDAHGNAVEVLVPAVKAGAKLACTEHRDHIQCQKDPRKLQRHALQKPSPPPRGGWHRDRASMTARRHREARKPGLPTTWPGALGRTQATVRQRWPVLQGTTRHGHGDRVAAICQAAACGAARADRARAGAPGGGSVSKVEIYTNNILQIKDLRAVVSTFDTPPANSASQIKTPNPRLGDRQLGAYRPRKKPIDTMCICYRRIHVKRALFEPGGVQLTV